MSDLNLFIPIIKVDAEQRLVYGIATGEAEDSAHEICDYASTKPYYEKWSAQFAETTAGKSLGNLRAMHGDVAAGKLTAINFNDAARQIEICAKVVDDAEWNKVLEGVYTGFSQGGRYVNRWADPAGGTRYTADPVEISLVDLPCLPSATFEIVKSDGTIEKRAFAMHKTNYSDAEREKMAEDGKAMPDGSYPIANKDDLENAIRAAGRAKDKEKVQAFIMRRAKDLDAEDMIPESWTKTEKAASADDEAAHDAAAAAQNAETAAAGDGDVTQDAADKALAALDLLKATVAAPRRIAKGLPTAAALLNAAEWLHTLKHDIFAEEKQEGDDTAVAGQLKQNLDDLLDSIGAYVAEELAELKNGQDVDMLYSNQDSCDLILSCAAGLPQDHLAAVTKFTSGNADFGKLSEVLSKAGARNSKADQEKIQAMHDHACDLGAACNPKNGDDAGDDASKSALGDLAKMTAERDMLSSALEKRDAALEKITADMTPLQKSVEELHARLAVMEKQAVPAKTTTSFARSKEEDVSGERAERAPAVSEEDVQKALAALSEEERSMIVLKAALAMPRPVIAR